MFAGRCARLPLRLGGAKVVAVSLGFTVKRKMGGEAQAAGTGQNMYMYVILCSF